MNFFLKGVVLGISIAAPIGPVALYCIRKTLQEGRLSGFMAGLGAATADTLYGIVSAFGFTALSFFLIKYETAIRLIGGLFLLYIAYKIFFSTPQETTKVVQPKRGASLISSYATTFLLNITNPTTILTFILIFEELGVVNNATFTQARFIVLGMFIGAVIWWSILTIGIGFLKKDMDPEKMVLVNKLSAILIAFLGIFSMLFASQRSLHKDAVLYAKFISKLKRRGR